jgi:hypothetical protein
MKYESATQAYPMQCGRIFYDGLLLAEEAVGHGYQQGQ